MIAPIIVGGIKLAMAFAPQIMGLFSSDTADDIEKVSGVVMAVAKSITGHSNEEDALAALHADPAAALAFQTALLADKHVAAKMAYADRADARDTYKVCHAHTDAIADRIMTYNLPAVIILAALNVWAVWLFKDDGATSAMVTVIITAVNNSLLTERQQVCGFKFGSSMGSKLKDRVP